MNTIQMSKVAQTILNRTGRNGTDNSDSALKIAEYLQANFNACALKYGINDEFDLIEAIALDVIKELK